MSSVGENVSVVDLSVIAAPPSLTMTVSMDIKLDRVVRILPGRSKETESDWVRTWRCLKVMVLMLSEVVQPHMLVQRRLNTMHTPVAYMQLIFCPLIPQPGS